MLFQTPNQQFESTELNVFSLLCSNMKYNCRMYEYAYTQHGVFLDSKLA